MVWSRRLNSVSLINAIKQYINRNTSLLDSVTTNLCRINICTFGERRPGYQRNLLSHVQQALIRRINRMTFPPVSVIAYNCWVLTTHHGKQCYLQGQKVHGILLTIRGCKHQQILMIHTNSARHFTKHNLNIIMFKNVFEHFFLNQ